MDLIYERGMSLMRYSVTDTAEYGDYVSGPRIITPKVKAEMKKLLGVIQDGSFAKTWIAKTVWWTGERTRIPPSVL